MEKINFYRGNTYPEIESSISKKYYHGVLTVNLAIFETGILTTFATEKEGVLFSEVIGAVGGGLSSIGAISILKPDYFEQDIKNYQCSFSTIPYDSVLENEELMKKAIENEEYDGLEFTAKSKTIYCFLTKGENSTFTLYSMIVDKETNIAFVGESVVKLSYSFD